MKYSTIAILLILSTFIGFAQENDKRGNKKPHGGDKEKQGQNQRQQNYGTIQPGNVVMGSATDHSITASVMVPSGTSFYIEYSNQSGNYKYKTNPIVALNDDPIEVEIDHLDANTQYNYRLQYKVSGSSEYIATAASWFSTQKKFGASFSFGVQGDSHPERLGKMFSPSLYKQTLDSVSTYKPDFYFMLGDDFNLDKLLISQQVNQANVEKSYQTQRLFLGYMGKNPPLYLVNGNHEQAAKYFLDGTDQNVAVLAGNARKKFFPLPAPGSFFSGDEDTVKYVGLLKDYYAFEWGNALFVVIDPYWHSDVVVDNLPGSEGKQNKKNPWGITIGDAQYKWLEKTLTNSKAKFKFVFAHHVLGTGRGGVERAGLFEWGGKGQNGEWQFDKNRPNWQLPIHQLMVRNKVTIFFQGHDHIYAKQELDGVIYQSVPNPADDTHTAFNKEAYLTGKILPNSGYLQVNVHANEVKVDYIRSYFANATNFAEEITDRFTYTIK